MFPDFDPSLLENADFKEDSVREIIITPMLGDVPADVEICWSALLTLSR